MPTQTDTEEPISWLDQALSRFDADNDTLILPTRSILGAIIPDPGLHGRFINTLSMLEHMGSYKIMATQQGASIDQPTLKHVAEEAHHAFFLKRQAEKEAGRSMEYVAGNLLAPAAARMYFQKLEIALGELFDGMPGPRTIYLYMSLIVEFRALWFYELYSQCLKRAGHGMSLKRILGEERSHLEDMADRLETAGPLNDAHTLRILNDERHLFERFLAALRRSST